MNNPWDDLPVLPPSQVRALYDEFGERQDRQAFYEDIALEKLVSQSRMHQAQAILEFGCGTGRLASLLLRKELPASCRYTGVDLSRIMVQLTRQRLKNWEDRVRVEQSDGRVEMPFPPGSFDRFLSTYVLDILSRQDTSRLLAEARRLLRPGGLLCLVNLAEGVDLPSRLVIALWKRLYRIAPAKLGGCRPVPVLPLVDSSQWTIEVCEVVSAWGIPSQVLIAARDARVEDLMDLDPSK